MAVRDKAVSQQTHTWLMHACTYDYPSEELTDNSGWPSGMMGPKRAQKLQNKGISNFKQLMQRAISMTESDFKAEFGGNGALDHSAAAFWEVLNTWHQAQCEKQGQKIPQTDLWLSWADTHDMPSEILEQREGWPPGMLGEIRVQKLESHGITKTSQLMDLAHSMNHDAFVKEFGGRDGALDHRAAAFHSFLLRSAARNGRAPREPLSNQAARTDDPKPTPSPNFVIIAFVFLVLAFAYRFMV
jgi:hypothetical protein